MSVLRRPDPAPGAREDPGGHDRVRRRSATPGCRGPAPRPSSWSATRTGRLRDLSWAPEADAEVEAVAADTEDGRSVIRHSAAHVLAQAVQQQFPEAKLGIGPPIRDGFYYDFDVAEPFTPEDLVALEKRMRQIIKSGATVLAPGGVVRRGRQGRAGGRAVQAGADRPQGRTPTTRRSMEVGGGELTIYDNLHAHTGERVWGDLCRGPHVPNTRYIPRVQAHPVVGGLLARRARRTPTCSGSTAPPGSPRRPCDAHLERLAEAERRDHRKLGAELDLFSFPDEIGSGLAVFHPKGGVIKREMEDYVRRRHIEEGFDYVGTPHITKAHVFEMSGHLPYYEDTMFPPMELEHARVLPQGHELPDAEPDLPVAAAVLPRPADPVLRVRHRVPVREAPAWCTA